MVEVSGGREFVAEPRTRGRVALKLPAAIALAENQPAPANQPDAPADDDAITTSVAAQTKRQP